VLFKAPEKRHGDLPSQAPFVEMDVAIAVLAVS